MLDELKSLSARIGHLNEPRKPRLLEVYSRLGSKPVPAAQPWVGEVRDNAGFQNYLDDLGETLRACGTHSIAGPQVGSPVQVVVIMVEGKPFALINPTLKTVSTGLSEEKFETTISYPGARVKVARPHTIEVSYINRKGEAKTETFVNADAGAIAQGLETLNGGSILDHLPAIMRRTAIQKGKILLRKYQSALTKAKEARKPKPKKARKKK